MKFAGKQLIYIIMISFSKRVRYSIPKSIVLKFMIKKRLNILLILFEIK